MLYQQGRSKIELLSTYLYELTVYAIGDGRAELLESKFITSKQALKIKKSTKIEKRKGYIIDRSIELLGAPQEYMDRYYLKPCE